MFHSLSQHFEVTVICGGDSNLALDVNVDSSKPPGKGVRCPSRASLCFAKQLQLLNLIDAWREKHPSAQDFTHYSHPHQIYSRIDHVCPSFLSSIQKAARSDLALLFLSFTYSAPGNHTFNFRLNLSPLSDQICCMEIENHMVEYF